VQRKLQSVVSTFAELPIIQLLSWCDKAYLTGATTIYECELITGNDLKGLQRRRHFGEAAGKYRMAIGPDADMKSFVYPALFALAESTAPSQLMPAKTASTAKV
jgi:hypothetical protein